MRRLAVFIFCLPLVLFSQERIEMSFQDYIQQVKSEHPLVRQAYLMEDLGQENLLKSKGGFDPKLQGSYNSKQFEDQNYYNLLSTGLKVPTWFGVTVGAGYSMNQGDFLNPENKTPTNGLYNLGVELPLGKGLFIDQRRADLKKAQIYSRATEAQRKLLLNEILLEAGAAYYKWFESYQNLKVYEQAKELALVRFNGVKVSALIGEGREIDTLEAGIQLQNRLVQLQQAELKYLNAKALIEVYLWREGNIPLELDEQVVPTTTGEAGEMNIVESLEGDNFLIEHPEMMTARLKVEQMEVQQKLTKEMLKPELNLKYNALANAAFNENATNGLDGYTWGASLSMPIFLRKERGANKMAKIKIEQANFSVDAKQAQLKYKAVTAMNTFQNLTNQIDVLIQNVSDYKQLLEGERELFDAGESSLFMVNSREMNFINTQVKLNKLQAEKQLAALNVYYALGILYQQ